MARLENGRIRKKRHNSQEDFHVSGRSIVNYGDHYNDRTSLSVQDLLASDLSLTVPR